MLFWPALQHLFTALGVLTSMFKTSAQLRLETLALRQQLTVSRRPAPERLKLTPADRFFFRVWLRAFGVTGNPPDDRQDGDSGRLASQGLPPVLDVESPLRQARSLTAYPTAEWTAQQLREAFPSGSAPRYLLRDRDQVFVQSHAITHAMWTHRHSMQIEFPDRLESVWRAGSYIQLTGNSGSDNRLHFAIPNPVICRRSPVEASAVCPAAAVRRPPRQPVRPGPFGAAWGSCHRGDFGAAGNVRYRNRAQPGRPLPTDFDVIVVREWVVEK